MLKRCSAMFAALLLGAMLAVPSANAAGRLNFMLTNLTDADITDVRICPTYHPDLMSDNLLKTNLEPNTRIYIGPNYYGDQRFWNIRISWSNGYTHTFTHSRLTRYNNYVTYASPYGVRMRQGYERAFARYSFQPSYAWSAPGREVALSMPEKVNVVAVASAAPAARHSVGAPSRRTRDLVFEDEDEAAPAVAGSAAAAVKGDTIAVKATVELTRDGSTRTVLPTEDFRSGDRVRMIFSANRDGHVYWLAKGSSGQYQVLFPAARAGMDNRITKNTEYTVPVKGGWRFDANKGTETLVCVLAPSAVPDLDQAVQLASAGRRDEASAIVERVVSGHETKRTTRDLVFEEEDEQDVNIKSQKSADGEPFVATYELAHN